MQHQFVERLDKWIDRFLNTPVYVKFRVLSGLIMLFMAWATISHPANGAMVSLLHLFPDTNSPYLYSAFLIACGVNLLSNPRNDGATWGIILIGAWVFLDIYFVYRLPVDSVARSFAGIVVTLGGFFALCLGSIRTSSH